MGNKLKVFLSYIHEDYEMAKEMKEYLEFTGLEVFLAHKDIEPSSEWQEEIHKALKECDVFIPLLTDKFRSSKWTDHEVGIAYTHNKKFIPLIIDIVPYGFMAKWQGLRVSQYFKEQSSVRKNECGEILNQIKTIFPERMRTTAFSSLKEIISFKQANAVFALLNHFQPFTKEEINSIMDASLENDQIIHGFGAKAKIEYWLEKYAKDVNPNTIISLMKKIKGSS